MSVNWTLIKAQINELIIEMTGLTAAQVVWRDEAAGGQWLTSPQIYLRISSITDVGYADELRTQQTDPTKDSVVTTVQQKKFVLSVRCESFEQDIANANHAGSILGTLRTRLQRTSSVWTDHDEMVLLTYGGAKWFNYVKDGRQVCVYTMDMVCGTVDVDVDTTPGTGQWIKEVIVDGLVKSEAEPDIAVHLDINS